jgi:hypothetical protein
MRSGAIIRRFVPQGRHVAHEVAFLLYNLGLAYFQIIIKPSPTDRKNFILNTVQ